MKTIIKTVVAIFFIISIVTTMLLSTVTFLFLNPKFYLASFAKPGVYTNVEKGLKVSATQSLRAQMAEQGITYDALTISERQQIDRQIESILSPINTDNIRDFSEKNIVNILNYINGKTGRLIIYLPLNKWGLSNASLQLIPDYLKSTDLDILKLKEDHPEINIDSRQIESLYNLGNRIKIFWGVSIILMIIFLLIHLSLGGPEFRFVKTGRWVTAGGILILFLAWVIKIFANTFGQNIAARSQATDILAGTILSALLDNVFKLWISCAVTLIVIGLLMFNIKGKKLVVNN